MTPYQRLYTYALQLTGSKRQARIIAGLVILESAELIVKTESLEEIPGFMITRVRTLSEEYGRRRKKRWFRGMWERFKHLRGVRNFAGSKIN